MTKPVHPRLIAAREAIVAAARKRLAQGAPTLIALDGGSGAGKSTLAAAVTEALDAAHVPGDDFYAAHVTDAEWDAMSAEERADRGIDWRRLRADALEPLLAGKTGRWHRFDFESGILPDGTYGMRPEACTLEPRPVVVLDGAYSARPELADLVDLAVLVDVPLATRHARLAEREPADFLAGWHAHWDVAEAHYFTKVRPRESFDLVVSNADASAPSHDQSRR